MIERKDNGGMDGRTNGGVGRCRWKDGWRDRWKDREKDIGTVLVIRS
jgi:hypothetical protein